MANSSRRKKKAPSIEVAKIPKLTLDMPLDAKKVAAIHECIAKGKLRITINEIDFAQGRIGEAWTYD